MNPEIKTETPAVDPAPVAGTGPDPVKDPAPSQEPVKPEKPKFTRRQTIKYNIERMQRDLENAPLEDGDEPPVLPPTPVSGLTLINEISDPAEKAAVEAKLKEMTPSGNPLVDLRAARLEVNKVSNDKFMEESTRKAEPRKTAASSGAPAVVELPFVPTPDEKAMMKMGNLTKDQILEVRRKEAEANK